MRPDGFYWIRSGRGPIQPAQWWSGKWWFCGVAEPTDDGKRIEVLGPCVLPSDGPA